MPLQSFENMTDARAFIFGGGVDDCNGQEIKLKRHPQTPGDTKRCVVFQCNSHAACPFVARAIKVKSAFEVQVVLGVQHADGGGSPVIRAGCDITVEQMKAIRKMADGGMQPASIRTSLIRAEKRRCERHGVEPIRRPEGGYEGVQTQF